MSRTYSISALIDCEFNEKNIADILSEGKILGLRYYEYDLEIDPFLLPEINISEATRKTSKLTQNFDNPNAINARIDDSFFIIFFSNKSGLIEIAFFGFDNIHWTRIFKYDGKEDLDIKQYLRFLLSLIKDYKIVSLHVNKD